MMTGRVPCLPENPLGLSWHDSAWVPMLNPSNILDYFSERSNPFYDRTCNNETIKMQRMSMDNLANMSGLEYTLLHVQEPILYVIRKQHRHSPNQTIPLADYYIIAGTVYQAPDLMSVVNSRLLTSVFHLESALDDLFNMTRYHPSKGYSWDTKISPSTANDAPKNEAKVDIGSNFQRSRTDMLLIEFTRRFPPPFIKQVPAEVAVNEPSAEFKQENNKQDVKLEPAVKIEPGNQSPAMKPPPEKKPKFS